MKTEILKHALRNAVAFEGKANVGAVLGKLLAAEPKLKENIKEAAREVQAVVNEVNKWSLEKQRAELGKLGGIKKKRETKKSLPPLKGAVKGKVVTRMPPEPSKYTHIGHALSFLINYLYAKKYDGKCILRFEDTNPETAYQEFVDVIQEDVVGYLGIKPYKTIFVSNDMPKFYKYAEKLLEDGNAYVCFCPREKMGELRNKGLPCEHRDTDINENFALWENMLDGRYKEGEAVLRLKGVMDSPNHVMRDPVIFRICYVKHYLQRDKYKVWPMYDFENAVEDSINGVTHILRSIEFGEMRVELQNYLKRLLGLQTQQVIQYGRFNITGAETKGREIRQLIKEKKVIGWDDPRLVTLKALRRRGIIPATFYELALEVGLSKTQTNLDWSVVSSINRKLIDHVTPRYFFVDNPQKLSVEGAPARKVTISLHPDNKRMGKRIFHTSKDFYIAKRDNDSLKEKALNRLMDCLNFRRMGNKFVFDSETYEKFKDKGSTIIHWLPVANDLVKVEVLMPDASVVNGFGEAALKKLKMGDVVQFVRFGFCRLDRKGNGMLKFWYTHD